MITINIWILDLLVKNNFDYDEKTYIIEEVIFFVEYDTG